MSRAILQVMIRGRVQGVGYRAWVEYQATASGLEGWVRNRRDGSVEALFAGAPTRVADMVALCRHGPPSARVDSVTSETASADELNLRGVGEKFSVLPTA
ncbi:acylphosphatase [Bradyrhizobium sp. B117]|uniref:acylphosphatase n=1 Tax=Bradyrhizobium sp. B117 TaxID=3140246 RepID=UPI003182ED8B